MPHHNPACYAVKKTTGGFLVCEKREGHSGAHLSGKVHKPPARKIYFEVAWRQDPARKRKIRMED